MNKYILCINIPSWFYKWQSQEIILKSFNTVLMSIHFLKNAKSLTLQNHIPRKCENLMNTCMYCIYISTHSMLCKHIYARLLPNQFNKYIFILTPPPPPTTHSLTIHFPYGLNELKSAIIWYTWESFNKIHVLKHSFSYLFFKIIISGKGKDRCLEIKICQKSTPDI